MEYKPLCETFETENQAKAIRERIDAKTQKVSRMMVGNDLIGECCNVLQHSPTEQSVYYASCIDDYNIIIAGWECSLMGKKSVNCHTDSMVDNVLSKEYFEKVNTYISMVRLCWNCMDTKLMRI